MTPLEFERWARLAKEDPAAFEAERRKALQNLATRAPLAKQAQLQALAEELLSTPEQDPLKRAQAANARMLESAMQLQTCFLEALKPLERLPSDDTFAEFVQEVETLR